jgi:hypothetical protein
MADFCITNRYVNDIVQTRCVDHEKCRLEKEQVRTMINAALNGLRESERTVNENDRPVDFNVLSSFVEK